MWLNSDTQPNIAGIQNSTPFDPCVGISADQIPGFQAEPLKQGEYIISGQAKSWCHNLNHLLWQRQG